MTPAERCSFAYKFIDAPGEEPHARFDATMCPSLLPSTPQHVPDPSPAYLDVASAGPRLAAWQ